jgi:predicted RecB family nuclease
MPCHGASVRDARIAEILKCNEEDLAATWAVFEWLRGEGKARPGGS